MQNTEKREAWIKENQQLLAGLAWARYQEEGRGALVMILDAAQSGLLLPIAWAIADELGDPFPSQLAVAPAGEAGKDLADVCREYDPRTEILVEFAWTTDEGPQFELHRFTTTPRPPQAYKQYRKLVKRALGRWGINPIQHVSLAAR